MVRTPAGADDISTRSRSKVFAESSASRQPSGSGASGDTLQQIREGAEACRLGSWRVECNRVIAIDPGGGYPNLTRTSTSARSALCQQIRKEHGRRSQKGGLP
jgi:hypothetical protein